MLVDWHLPFLIIFLPPIIMIARDANIDIDKDDPGTRSNIRGILKLMRSTML